MQVTVETTEGLGRRMRVQVPEERISSEVTQRLGSLAKEKIRIPGFRPGKVPAKVMARHFGGRIRNEVIGDLMRESFLTALEQENLRPAAAPQIEPENVASPGLDYVATFEVLPEIRLAPFESLRIARPVASVEEANVDRVIENMRKQRLVWKEVQRPATENDRVTVDSRGYFEGEEIEGIKAEGSVIELQARETVPELKESLIGACAGDEKSFEMVYPAPEPAHLTGKTVRIDLKVHRVEESELPAIDEEFAKSFGVAEGGIDVLRADVRRDMERELESAIASSMKRRVVDALLDANDIELPQSMVREEIERGMARRRGYLERAGIPENRMAAILPDPDTLIPEARRRLAIGLIFAEIARENRIEADGSKVRDRVETIASTYQDPQAIINWYYSEDERLAEIESEVLEQQIVDWIVERADIDEEELSFDRIMNPEPEPNPPEEGERDSKATGDLEPA
eukprot:XP_011407382.1 PREDICTED: uncharacterized protein LOC100632430 [Amphimedon queenslandica]